MTKNFFNYKFCLTEMIRNPDLIVWDECTKALKKSAEALDKTLRDLLNDNRFMGGITFLFAGDFR